MKIIYDPAKNDRNIRERGLSFERVADFEFDNATFLTDDRREYNELRRVAIGYLDGRLHHLCFVETTTGIRVISFRKANQREARKHDKTLTIDRCGR
ncbi:MAG: BrnT family toxin [Pseudomonadota bacterium]|nr:BrnT family toxin [Pseudomonadota bacterium]MDP1905237.1 BrnT family toxin [Pseudomonadota bacterium]MDP2352799.1 BrnT family toxin [Pseudomonadota bacterium]